MFGRFRARLVMAAAIASTLLFAAPAAAAEATPSLPNLGALAPPVTMTVQAPQAQAAPVRPVSAQTAPVQAGIAPAVKATPSLADLVRSAPTPAVVPAIAAAPAPLALQSRSLHDMVISFVNYGNQDEEQLCLAKAVYFEARSETLEGQLAVAEVVLNRARSGVYPRSICAVVTQPAQFSFIRSGRFPEVDASSACWKKALAIAEVASKHLATSVAPNVLWYHATYVAPSWGRQKTRAAQIGTHIFYS